VHSQELNQLAREAQSLQARQDFAAARDLWNRSLAMLPPDSKQADWVRGKLLALEMEANSGSKTAKPETNWARKLGPLGPIAILLAKSKGILVAIFKLKFLFSLFAFAGLYWAMFGWRFGLGFAASILIHEMGHYIDIKRRGWPAEMPVFLPGLGAYVRWKAIGVTLSQRAEVSLAGPLAGLGAALVCLALYFRTGSPIWSALARTGAALNVLNLIPVWILDGGSAVHALARPERLILLAAALGLWLYTGEGIFFLVAVGAAWCVFQKDRPSVSSWNTLAYYAAVMIALGFVLMAVPVSSVRRF
jgi:Zn-dependent protease